MGSSPQPSGFALGLWWASQVVGDTTMTSILVSIPITPNQRCIIKWLGYQQAAIHYHKHICNIVANRSQVMSTSLPEASIFLMAKQSHPIWLSNYIPHGNTMNIEIPVSGTEGPLRWRHNDHASVSNHQPHGCLLNRLFRRKSKKTSKLRVTGLCAGNSPGTGEFPHKWPVTRKMFPFDDVIMLIESMNKMASCHSMHTALMDTIVIRNCFVRLMLFITISSIPF